MANLRDKQEPQQSRNRVALTEKELAVLRLRKEGLTQVEVSKRLKISQAAISSFEKNAYRKLVDAQEMLELARKEKISLPEVRK